MAATVMIPSIQIPLGDNLIFIIAILAFRTELREWGGFDIELRRHIFYRSAVFMTGCGGMAEWSIAADCKSAELSSTLVQIQLPPPLQI